MGGVWVCVCGGCAGVRQGVCVSNLISVILHYNYLKCEESLCKGFCKLCLGCECLYLIVGSD